MSRCPVFPLVSGKTSLQVMQIMYCESRYERCARYRSAQDGVAPPRTLLPDGTHADRDETARP